MTAGAPAKEEALARDPARAYHFVRAPVALAGQRGRGRRACAVDCDLELDTNYNPHLAVDLLRHFENDRRQPVSSRSPAP
jgi:hypothetical protein